MVEGDENAKEEEEEEEEEKEEEEVIVMLDTVGKKNWMSKEMKTENFNEKCGGNYNGEKNVGEKESLKA